MKAVVAAFNQEKALVGAFSVITSLRMDLFEALVSGLHRDNHVTVFRQLHPGALPRDRHVPRHHRREQHDLHL